MALTVNTNIASLNAQRNLSITQVSLNKSLQRLSSGLRINSAADDAAGLAISEGMKAQIRSMNQAVRNANDGVSLVQVAEGALNEVSNVLGRMRELTTQAATNTLTATQRSYVNGEYLQLKSEITRIANATDFNGTKLLQSAKSVAIQVGTGSKAYDRIGIKLAIMSAGAGGLALTSIGGASGGVKAQAELAVIDKAINSVSKQRASLGAIQNRLQSTINNLQVASENTSAAQSRIADADVAAETANMTRANILVQAGTAILAQANQAPQAALSLLR
ncbi:flagellin N-terminal helical domain-containing protein [Geotalea uraniireducens]|uniref:Flagellin n=1 Tax=Geotalea uraniireducens (strain Rf4) TaxID=351605 RepID=A5G8X0_GEOUR|nr:flagellin [Geotalea uraniireducens]ABQ28238.1 flagellin domain protein [Geotalea uraniireducens Rf4]